MPLVDGDKLNFHDYVTLIYFNLTPMQFMGCPVWILFFLFMQIEIQVCQFSTDAKNERRENDKMEWSIKGHLTKNLHPQFFRLLQRLPWRDCRINVEVWMQVFDSKCFLTSPTLLKWFHGIQICQHIDCTSSLAYKSPSNVWKEMESLPY